MQWRYHHLISGMRLISSSGRWYHFEYNLCFEDFIFIFNDFTTCIALIIIRIKTFWHLFSMMTRWPLATNMDTTLGVSATWFSCSLLL